MSKTVKYTETVKQWEGIAIVRDSEGLKEIPLGVATTDKKLKETGAKELFQNIPLGTIAVEVKKLDDVSTVYELDVEKFKELAEVSEVHEEKATEEPNQE